MVANRGVRALLGATPPSSVPVPDGDRHIEASRDPCRCQYLIQRSGCYELSPAHQTGMGEGARYLLAMMCDEDGGGTAGICGQDTQPGDETFPRPEVEPGRRLIEQEQFRLAHQRTGQEDMLAFTL